MRSGIISKNCYRHGYVFKASMARPRPKFWPSAPPGVFCPCKCSSINVPKVDIIRKEIVVLFHMVYISSIHALSGPKIVNCDKVAFFPLYVLLSLLLEESVLPLCFSENVFI